MMSWMELWNEADENRIPAPVMYTEEGRVVGERLWRETLEELKFVDVEGILRDVRG